MEPTNTTRRSFLKRTTSLAVGLSATTLFTGLTHASVIPYSNGSSCQRKDLGTLAVRCARGADNYWECSYNHPTDNSIVNAECGNGISPNNAPDDWLWCPGNDC